MTFYKAQLSRWHLQHLIMHMIMNLAPKNKLLLHSCCAPCLTAVYERLLENYDITVYWYNPNIWPKEEHSKRLETLKSYCQEIGAKLLQENYNYENENLVWRDLISGFELNPEKSQRCRICYEMRLRKTARIAKREGFEIFASELSVSPHKNSAWLNEIGQNLENEYHTKYLISDFKKRGGFLRSVELSKKHKLYRQDYCGCEFSKK